MEHKTALRLKKAGFPQHLVKSYYSSDVWIRHIKEDKWYPGTKKPLLVLEDHGRTKPYKWPMFSYQKGWEWENFVYCPTTDELIEELGERFEELNRIGHGGKSPKWTATSYSCEECGIENMEIGSGTTPQEALANLYLKLNEK